MKIILIVLLVLAVLASPLLWKLFICQVHEKDYGVNTKWTLLSGCMIETKPGVYVPEGRYRGMAE